MESTHNNSNEDIIRRTLIQLGVPTNLRGYSYLVQSIDILVKNPLASLTICTSVYQKVADELGVTSSSVETAIRNAITLCIPRIDETSWVKVFGRERSIVLGGKTTMKNSSFITSIAEYIAIEFNGGRK